MDNMRIANITFRAFLHVVKKRRLYHLFRGNVDSDMMGTLPLLWGLYQYKVSCQFSHANGIQDVVRLLDAVSRSIPMMPIPNELEQKEELKEQMMTVHMSNIMIHEFVEPYQGYYGIDLDALCKEVFETVCRKMYGERFKNLM